MTDFAKLVLDADTKGLKSGERDLDRMGKQSQRTAGDVDRSSGAMASSFSRVARIGILPLVGALASIGFGLSSLITINSQFGASMSNVAAISGATADELRMLTETAKEMGAQTKFSASEAADALGFLAMAGFNANEAIEALPSVLALAAASGMDLAQAADIASNVLSGFNKETAEAGQVADVLAKAASVSNTNVGQLGAAMSTVAPIAAALGISMEEAAASIGVMSDAGIQGERAGTALRGVFASLAGPTTQAQEALAKYGLTAADVNPETNKLADILGKLRDKGLSTADAMTIFGREAASGALVMVQTADRVRELTGEFDNAAGSAQKMADVMNDNLAGDISSLKSALEGMIINLGEGGATGAFRTLAQAVTESVRAISENFNTITTVIGTAIVGFTTYKGVVLAVAAAQAFYNSTLFNTIGVSIIEARTIAGATAAKTAYAIATTAATGAARAFTAALIANPFTAVAVAVGVLASAMFFLSQKQAQARQETDNLIRSLQSLAKARSADFKVVRDEVAGKKNIAQEELFVLEEQDRLIAKSGKTLGSSFGRGTSERLAEVRRKSQELRFEVTTLDGQLRSADKAFKAAGKAADSMVSPVAQAGAAVGELGKATESAGKKASVAADEMEKLRDRIDSLFDQLFPDEARENVFEQQVKDLAKAMDAGEMSADKYNRMLLQLKMNKFDDDEARFVDQVGATKSKDSGDIQAPIGAFDDFAKSLPEVEDATISTFEKIAGSVEYMAGTIGQSIDNISNGFKDFVSSIKKGDIAGILIGLANTIGSILGAFGSGGSLSGLFGGTPKAPPGKATGGAVSAGQSYLVGENRPEIFTPNSNGFITPKAGNDNMNISVEASPYFDVRVNGQIVAAAPSIAQGGAKIAGMQGARQQSRRVR